MCAHVISSLRSMVNASFVCREHTLNPVNTGILGQSSSSQTRMPFLSDCSSSGSSDGSDGSDEDCCSPAPAFHVPVACTSLDLDSLEPLSFGRTFSETGMSGPAAHGSSCFPPEMYPVTQQHGQFHLIPLQIRQHAHLSAVGIRDAASSFLQAEAAESRQRDEMSDSQFTQPLLWMSHKCHWTVCCGPPVSSSRNQIRLNLLMSLLSFCFVTVSIVTLWQTTLPMSACQSALDKCRLVYF